MRRLRAVMLDEVLLVVGLPGFLLCVGWAVMYEIYHEDGSYYTTLMQEILSSDDLFFLYFLISALLMAVPVGFVIDTVREVVGERWLGVPRARSERVHRRSSMPERLLRVPFLGHGFEERYVAYRHARFSLLSPAKTAGNLALVVLIFVAWFVVKIVRMQGWHVFSMAFILGTPVVGLGIFTALCARYVIGVAEFQTFVDGAPGPVSQAAEAPPPSPSPAIRLDEPPQPDAR